MVETNHREAHNSSTTEVKYNGNCNIYKLNSTKRIGFMASSDRYNIHLYVRRIVILN